MTEPFVIRSLEPGMADLIDRLSGEKVGYLLLRGGPAGDHQEGFLPFDPEVSWEPRKIALGRLRAECARTTWFAVQGMAEKGVGPELADGGDRDVTETDG